MGGDDFCTETICSNPLGRVVVLHDSYGRFYGLHVLVISLVLASDLKMLRVWVTCLSIADRKVDGDAEVNLTSTVDII